MPKAKRKRLSQSEQSQRFKDMAKELGADESGKRFEKAFKKLVRPKPDTVTKRP